MKRLNLIIFLILFCFGLGARADNIVTIGTSEGVPDDEVTVSVSLQNTDDVSSLQVSIPLDKNLTLVEGAEQLGSRCSSHALTVGVKDGVLNVFVYSLSMATISGSSGEVASFKLKLGNQPATLPLTPNSIVLSAPNSQLLNASSQSGSVTIRCAKAQYSTMEVDFGEVPIHSTSTRTVTVKNVGNADLTITSLIFSDVNVFSTTTTGFPLTISPNASKVLNITYAPVDRGSISKTLKVVCNSVSKLNTISLLAKPYAVNELHVQSATGISGEEVTVKMTMNNMDPISGFQVEFDLPEQFEYVDGSFALSSRKLDHVAMTSLHESRLRILAYSSTGKAFTGDEGEIGSFKLKLVRGNSTLLTPTNTVLTATINNKVEDVVSGAYGGYITIKSPRIICNGYLYLGSVSVTEACEKTFTISNYGNAPLSINRIVFDNEAFSVKETLPIKISSGGSSNITVVYSSIEPTSFEGRMQIYCNDPDQRLREVVVTGSRFAPNYISAKASVIRPTDDATINVSLDNYNPISGMQFDVEYPDTYFEPTDEFTTTTRSSKMSMSKNSVGANVVRYFIYSLNDVAIAPGKGRVFTLKFHAKGETPKGSYNLRITNVNLATADMQDKYSGTDLTCTLTVRDILPGDVNGDGKVNITDAVGIVNYLLGNPSDGFIEAAADVSGDGNITITDAVAVVNMILQNGISVRELMLLLDKEIIPE